MPALQIYLLGSLEIRFGDQYLPKPATIKSQSLLAYLATHRRTPEYREQLSGLFWGEWPEHKARRSLSTALWHIRTCLPDDNVILSESDTVQFDPNSDLWLDTEEFISRAKENDVTGLQSAVALYRGDFLEGFYDEWIINQRYRLENLFCEALSRLMTLQMENGSYRESIATSIRLLEIDSLSEEAYRVSMRAYCLAGQRNKALAQYQTCRERVQEELGTEPMPETTELYQSILGGDIKPDEKAGFRPLQAWEVPAHTPVGRNPLDAITFSQFVGRDQELAFLQNCWQRVKAGDGKGVVLVSGDSGIGKTRLVDEFASLLRRQGHRILRGRCYEFERILPYQPFGEALQAGLPLITDTELVDLPQWALQAIAQFLPDLLDKFPKLFQDTTIHPEQEDTRLFNALARLLARISADRAALVILEDLHWASTSTLQMLHHLLRALSGQMVMIIGTLRPEAATGRYPFLDLQEELRREDLIQKLSLSGLSKEQVEQIIVEMSGAGKEILPLARKLYQETEGNPFFLIETVKSLFDQAEISMEKGTWTGDFARISRGILPLPHSISEAILSRVRTLDDDARYAVRLAAVLGNEFDFDALSAAWGQGDEPSLKALDNLLHRRMVSEAMNVAGRDYVFTHHKIREAVYSSIPRLHRQRLHAQIGEVLESLHDPQIELLAGELAYHFEQCRKLNEDVNEKAIGYLLMAGDHARGLYAFSEAIDYYQRALTILKEEDNHERIARTLMKLGLTHHLAFDFQQARQTYEQSFATWQREMEMKFPMHPPAPHALRLVAFVEPFSINPILADDFGSGSVISQIFSGLVELTPELDILPDIARDWQVLEDGRKYIFHLRQDVHWSDGVPVTARDFEYTWKQILDPAVDSPNAYLLKIVRGARAFQQRQVGRESVGIRAPDPVTLVVELEEPVGYFLQLITRIRPVPRHVVNTVGDAWTEMGNIVTNGPFEIDSWKRGESLTLTRYPNYHGHFRGNVERAELLFGLDPGARLERYKVNDLDVLHLQGLPHSEVQDISHRRYPEEYTLIPRLVVRSIGFDCGQPPFDDPRVRQALALTINKEQLINVLYKGLHSPATGGLLPPGMPGHSPGIALPYDPERAKQLLAEANYPGGSGFPELEALLYYDFYARLGEYLHEQWQKILGIDIHWKAVTGDEYIHINKPAGPHANLHVVGYSPAYPDPEALLGMGATETENNWRHAGYGKLVKQAAKSQNQEERMQLYRQADRILTDEAVIVPLFYHWYPMLIKPWIKNFAFSPVQDWFCRDIVIEPH